MAVDNSSAQIAGYYTLSAPSFEKDCLPAEVTKRLPHYPVPGAVVGRLAADLRSQRSGLGEVLLLDAIYRVVCAGDVGIATVAVTAPKDRTAKSCRVLTT
ncbi:MAG: hypothetical protein OXF74_06710 [Rhodobacteraceae bacterium]|nr:hypothetical protein [Paracoccaceae bacterium]